MSTNLASVAVADRNRKSREGVVVSDKMSKTRVVEVVMLTRHYLYGKVRRLKKRYYVHDETNGSMTGDRVVIEESKPISKLKRWRVIKILEKGAA